MRRTRRHRRLGALAMALAAVAAGAALLAGTLSASRSRDEAHAGSSAARVRTEAAPTPCANVVAGWPESRLLAQLLMLAWTYTRAKTLAPSAAAGVGAFEMAFAPGVGPRTTPATSPRVRAVNKSLVEDAIRAGQVPPIISTDAEGGMVTRLEGILGSIPAPRQIATAWTTAHLQQVMTTRGRRMKALGFDMDTGPVYTISSVRTPVYGGSRDFSTSPTVAAEYGDAFAKGLASAGLLAVAKHFPGEGHATGDTDRGVAMDPPLETLKAHDLVSFEGAIAAKVPAVMVGNPIVPGLSSGLPASLSPATYRLLRTTLGFTGLVITDTLGVKGVSMSGDSVTAAIVKAVEAGTDMPMLQASTWRQALGALEHAVSTGALPARVVRTRAEHVLVAKRVCTTVD